MPNPNLNMGEEYWCSLHMTDTEPDNPACQDREDVNDFCFQCPFLEKQSYTIVTRREDQKEFI